MVLNVHRLLLLFFFLLGTGRRGYGGARVCVCVGGEGAGEITYLSLHCHHQNDLCIKVGSDESHFNILLIVRDKVTSQCPQTTTFEATGEPKRSRSEVPLLTSLTPYRYAKPAHEISDYACQCFIMMP